MSLNQDRYIKIETGKGTVGVAARNLQTLVITDSSANTGYAFDEMNDIECNSVDEVSKAFGASSKEFIWATYYFAYSSPNGGVPTSVIFAKKVATDSSANAAFTRIVGRTNNFGVFTFLVTLSTSDINAIGESNAGYNYRFQFVAPITMTTLNSSTYKTEANPLNKYVEDCVGSSGCNGTHLVFQKEIVSTTGVSNYSATTTYEVDALVKKDNRYYKCITAITTAHEWKSSEWKDVTNLTVPNTYILAAVLSAIDWEQTDGTVSPMFRTISGVVADVTTEKSVRTDSGTSPVHDWTYSEVGADDLDALNVNYYGQVQVNGVQRSFYQKGVNSDDETALVYMGEVWLKSEISTRVMEMMLSLSKIKANADGNAKVYTVIDSACIKGVTNGVIEVGKTLGEVARMQIFSQTRDANAADIIEERGYWLNSKIVKDDDGKNYKAKYLLLYSKEDIIVKVEGTDVLY